MKKTFDQQIYYVVITTGISSVVTQLLIIREFLSQFSGNEFVIALILFAWLLFGGFGTLLAHLIKPVSPPVRLCWISFILAVLSPIELFSIRIFRDVFFTHGASAGFYPTLAYLFVSIAPYCLLVGFALPFSLIVAKNIIPGFSGTRIYIIDNCGDILGGALFSFALVSTVTPFTAVFIANIPLLFAGVWLYVSLDKLKPGIIIGTVACLCILATILFLETKSLNPQTGDLIYYKESRYGRIQIAREQDQVSLFVNGQPVFSNQNSNIAEEIIHYPLSQLGNPSHILMISAEAGMMKETEKYHPDVIDYVEIDPDITDALFRFKLLNKIPGLNVIHRDGRAYLKNTDRLYDAILINLPEPDTFQVNRFFTDRFFTLAKQHLKPDGVVSFFMEGFDNYISDEELEKVSSLYQTAKTVFQNVLMLPGNRIYFLCSDITLNDDIPALLDKKNITTFYIKGYFYGNVTSERIQQLNHQINANAPLNLDYSPQLIRLMFSQWFSKFSASPSAFMIGLMMIMGFYLFCITKEEFVLFTTGCVNMGSEVLVIFAFQIFFGYIYFKIGIIVTVFLAGLLPGAIFGESIRRYGTRALVLSDIFLVLLMTVFVGSIFQFGDHLPETGILMFGFLVSVVCGCQFPIALYLCGSDKPAAVKTFSADLMGAAFGTLITSVVLIPYVGIIWSGIVLIFIKMLSLATLKYTHDTRFA